MLYRYFIGVFTFICLGSAFALSPKPELKLILTQGKIKSYELTGKDIEVNATDSDLKYEDLTEKELSAVKDLMSAKQEYGKMFGFPGWKSTGHKLIEKNGERIVLIEGSYQGSKNNTVNFIEVYWASKAKAGQYLITSEKLPLKMDNYSDYLK